MSAQTAAGVVDNPSDNNFFYSRVVTIMRSKSLVMLSLAGCLAACRDRPTNPPPTTEISASATASSTVSTAVGEPATRTDTPHVRALDPFAPDMTDAELGKFIIACSEPTGDFPSDNYVSNETSYLHAASSILDEKLRGKAYVGVGPEQNLTYVVMMRPAVAYIVDIRRQNMIEHMVLRAVAEQASDRATFLARLTGRDIGCCKIAKPELAAFEEIADMLSKAEPSAERVTREVERTVELMDRLGIEKEKDDVKRIRKVLEAFADKGLDLAYSMEGSGRKYPRVRELLAAIDPTGEQRSFAADEASFRYLQGMYRANRIVPVVGDFSGDRALQTIAKDVRERNLTLGIFYTSNVEQYLFEGGTYAKFVANVRAFPVDETSRFLRVWFDQGRAHPRQQKGHRTTSLSMPMQPFLTQHARKPFVSYWQVMTYEGPFEN